MLLTAPTAKEVERSYRVSALTFGRDNNKPKNDKQPDVGKTGVELRYYKRAEYDKLNSNQKAELHQWRKSKNSGGSGKSPDNSAKISSL